MFGVLVLVGAGCGSDDGSSSAPAEHNQADISFVTGMIPHHEQAVTMSSLAGTRAANPKVKDIARRIDSAQEPEITQMKDS